MVVDFVTEVRKLLQDFPRARTKQISNCPAVVRIEYAPVQDVTINVNGTPKTTGFTLDEDNGIITFTTAPATLVTINYKTVWFKDDYLERMAVMRPLDEDLVQVDIDKWRFLLPAAPVYAELTDEQGVSVTATYANGAFSISTTVPPTTPTKLHILGAQCDLFGTAATLYMVMASDIEGIRRKMGTDVAYGDYAVMAAAFREQAKAYLGFGGIR
jgi:hypothetical protein